MEDDDSSAKYDIASGILFITLSKVNQGEHFPDLDMTNRLLARTGEVLDDRNNVKGPPRIQLVEPIPSEVDPFDEAIQFDFQIPQTVEEPVDLKGAKYGFNNQYSGHFQHLQNPDVLTVTDVENKSVLERWEEMRRMEDGKFDKEWYLADRLEPPEELTEIMQFELSKDINDPFSMEEQTQLRNIGRRDCMPLSFEANVSSHRESKGRLSQSSSPIICNNIRPSNHVILIHARITMDHLSGNLSTLVSISNVHLI